MIDCPSPEDLDRYRQGRGTPDERSSVAAHLTSCDRCRTRLTEAADDDLLSRDIRRVVTRRGYAVLAPRDDTFAGYRIVRRVGAGGMGMVYEAEQEHPKRTIALKVVRFDAMSARAVKRFEHESEALGRLHHPGIAQVFDAGATDTGDGRQPYFAMEFVRGDSITAHAKTRRLTVPQRLELMIQVCEAVEHAHRRGVIHRDLKPSNVLVDEAGRTKILDFGVAKMTDSDLRSTTLQTCAGELIGTVPYMSPEQLAGDPGEIDTRTDVYALGVMLYELVAGRLPYALDGKSIPEAIRVIASEEPTSLASIERSFRGDLNTLVAKAMDREKARRYQSSSALAADIRRYLEVEPLAARPATTMYQLGKFARRNKGLVAGAVTIAVVLVAALAVVTAFAVRASREREDAVQARARSERIIRFYQDMLESPDPARMRGENVTVAQVLDEAAARVQDELPAFPRVELAVRLSIARTYQTLARLDKAEHHAQAAVEIARRELGAEHADALAAAATLAAVWLSQGRWEESADAFERLLPEQRRVAGADDRQSLHVLAGLASALESLERLDEAERLDRELIARARGAHGPEDDLTITGMGQLANVLREQGRWDEAAEQYAEVLELVERVHGETHPHALITRHNLALVMRRLERYDEAEALYRQSLELDRRVFGDEHLSTLNTMNNLGVVLRRMGRPDEAEALYRECLEVSLRVLGETHPRSVGTMNNLGLLLRRQGRLEEARPYVERVVELAPQVYGEGHSNTVSSMQNLARLYAATDRSDDADELLRELVDLVERTHPIGHWRVGHQHGVYGTFLIDEQRYDEAEPHLVEGLAMLEAAVGPEDPRTVGLVRRLIELYEAWERPDEAERYRAMLPAEAAAPDG